tara:strand:+ start:455 stop:916 length:462 start_codon:yes stop_codon:yes gene_type:complete
MSTKDRVFSRLFDGQKHNLNTNLTKEHKVALSLVSSLITEFEPLQESFNDAAYLAYDWGDEILDAFSDFQQKYPIDDFIVNGNARNLKEQADTMRGYLEELEQKSEELGLNPADIFDDYEDTKYLVDNANSMYDDMIAKYREIISYVGIADFS